MTSMDRANFRILIVDDEPGICRALSQYLEREGYTALTASSAEEALQLFQAKKPDMAIVDYRLPGMDGLSFMKKIRRQYPDVEIALITAYGGVDMAIQATQDGAFAYLPKPFDLKEVGRIVRQSLERSKVAVKPSGRFQQTPWELHLSGNSPAILKVNRRLADCAGSFNPVLFIGEVGSGREAAARSLHSRLPSDTGPFRAVHCGALPSGKINQLAEIASPITREFVFLAELGEVDPSATATLLGSVRERSSAVSSRFAASIRLPHHSESGRFPTAVIHAAGKYDWEIVEIPPLRERLEDLPHLVATIMTHVNKDTGRDLKGVHENAMAALLEYPWPGNIRELKNTIHAAALATRLDAILPESLPWVTSGDETNTPIDAIKT